MKKEFNPKGCQNGFCYIKGKAHGMHTNATCSCLRNQPVIEGLPELLKVLEAARELTNIGFVPSDLEMQYLDLKEAIAKLDELHGTDTMSSDEKDDGC